MPPCLDLVILSRDDGPLMPQVQRGLATQRGVELRVHRVIAGSRPGDINRWETIARKRNIGKRLGTSPWLMFLDDDVELEPNAVSRLIAELQRLPHHAALAVDYVNHRGDGNERHVPMGATLFRREALRLFEFRWEPGRCECQCCCDDLRRHALGVGFSPDLRATHWRHARPDRCDMCTGASHAGSDAEHSPVPAELASAPANRPGCVLAAFDRRHVDKFRRQFLGTLRAAGNVERVVAVGYGLYPSEVSRLSQSVGVEVVARPAGRELPPIARLRDFPMILDQFHPATPVAYWDAGDVFFQNRLEALWQLVREHPQKVLAVREPTGHPRNPAVAGWTLSIADSAARRRAWQLIRERPFLNSGFAAGTAGSMLAYFHEADRMRHSSDLLGSTDWGDQMALNLFCHSDPSRWQEIPEGWNFCVHDRSPGQLRTLADGRLVNRAGPPIHVVHGNAHSYRHQELC